MKLAKPSALVLGTMLISFSANASNCVAKSHGKVIQLESPQFLVSSNGSRIYSFNDGNVSLKLYKLQDGSKVADITISDDGKLVARSVEKMKADFDSSSAVDPSLHVNAIIDCSQHQSNLSNIGDM